MSPPTLALTVLEGKARGGATHVISCDCREDMGSVDRKERDDIADIGILLVQQTTTATNTQLGGGCLPGSVSRACDS